MRLAPITIAKGCKQGDPIASYLFIFCGHILSYLLDFDCQFKGFTIGEKEFKLSQFADDTTVFLDGYRDSHQSAPNIIEIVGSFTGLKINKNKTKMIWIGKQNLDWGTTQFDLLALRFSVNLDEMTTLNYSLAFEKAKKLLQSWKWRPLTPIGRITVIKTFIL